MMGRIRRVRFPIAIAACALAISANASEPAAAPTPEEAMRVRVADLSYGGGATSVCFSSGYLALLDRETTIDVAREPVRVELGSDTLFEFPFAVLSGEGGFQLTDAEAMNLRLYLERGGFVLASAGCSNDRWARDFEREVAAIFADNPLQALGRDHEVFHTVFDVNGFQTSAWKGEAELYGLSVDGRLAMIYSPQGLNDTGNAGGGCCCCGGNEIRNAKYINANVLAYALTR